MNDFTKDELQYLFDYVFKGAASISVDKHEILKSKMKRTIDNYCDHARGGRLNYDNTNEIEYVCRCCGIKIEGNPDR